MSLPIEQAMDKVFKKLETLPSDQFRLLMSEKDFPDDFYEVAAYFQDQITKRIRNAISPLENRLDRADVKYNTACDSLKEARFHSDEIVQKWEKTQRAYLKYIIYLEELLDKKKIKFEKKL